MPVNHTWQLPLFADVVHRIVLSLYMAESSLPLPTPEEVILCTEDTTSEEVLLTAIQSNNVLACSSGRSMTQTSKSKVILILNQQVPCSNLTNKCFKQ